MRITLHARGGLSVYGGGFYDPHTNEAIIMASEGETAKLTIEYPSAPSSPTKTEDGISATTPTISGSKLTSTLSGFRDGGHITFTASSGGETRKVRIRSVLRDRPDGYSS